MTTGEIVTAIATIAGVVVAFSVAAIGWRISARKRDRENLDALSVHFTDWWDGLVGLTTRSQVRGFDAPRHFEEGMERILDKLSCRTYRKIARKAEDFRTEAIRYKWGTRLNPNDRGPLITKFDAVIAVISDEIRRLRRLI